jgi:hypothetical protein
MWHANGAIPRLGRCLRVCTIAKYPYACLLFVGFTSLATRQRLIGRVRYVFPISPPFQKRAF